MRKLWLFLCLFLILPGSAQAASDVIATYTYSDGTKVTLCTRDSEHVRMDTSPTAYTLLANGKVYSVTCDNGQCQCMDMGAMAGMAGGFASMFGGGSETQYDVRYEKTGKTETVAGYKGTVYKAVILEDGKEISREEMVFSTHTNIKKLTEGWIAMAEVLSQSMGQSFQEIMDKGKEMGYGGMLRYGDQMRLTKLTIKSLDAAYYQLPKGAQQVQAQPQGDTDLGLDDDAKEIGYDAKEATKSEIKGSIRDAISDLFK